jgi:uncharacterized protein
MIALVEQKKDALVELCRRFMVKRLDLVGSAAKGGFNPEQSDLDFVVSFATTDAREYKRCYFGLAEGLENLFQRRVDLLTERSIRNPYFRQSIDETRQSVYGT